MTTTNRENLLTLVEASSLCEKREEIRGCSESDLADIEKFIGIELPNSYRFVMSKIGRSTGGVLEGPDVEFCYPGVKTLTDQTRNILSRYKEHPSLPDKVFVFFAANYFDEFCFFDLEVVAEEPSVFWCNEGWEIVEFGTIWDLLDDLLHVS